MSVLERSDLWIRRVSRSTGRSRCIESSSVRLPRSTRVRAPHAMEPRFSGEDEQLWRAVRRLPRRQAAAVVLSTVEGLTAEEIGSVLGCSGQRRRVTHIGPRTLAKLTRLSPGGRRIERDRTPPRPPLTASPGWRMPVPTLGASLRRSRRRTRICLGRCGRCARSRRNRRRRGDPTPTTQRSRTGITQTALPDGPIGLTRGDAFWPDAQHRPSSAVALGRDSPRCSDGAIQRRSRSSVLS